MAKHIATTPELRMAIRSMRSIVRQMDAEIAPDYLAVSGGNVTRYQRKVLDKARLELADLRHLYYKREDKDFGFITTDLQGRTLNLPA